MSDTQVWGLCEPGYWLLQPDDTNRFAEVILEADGAYVWYVMDDGDRANGEAETLEVAQAEAAAALWSYMAAHPEGDV